MKAKVREVFYLDANDCTGFQIGQEVKIVGKLVNKKTHSGVSYVVIINGESMIVDSFLIDDGIKVLDEGVRKFTDV